jgi:ABC-type transport system involved in multi-copper enzyme maturation permease subunit
MASERPPIIATAFFARIARPRFCGPVLFYDIVRTARRSRYALVRCVYGAVLFCLFLLVAQACLTGWDVRVDAKTLAEFADAFFSFMVILQFMAVIVLTPGYAGSAITEEKERRTIEYILATDLTNREIVLGKFLSRLGNTALLLLTGLPIVALIGLLGGIDPNLLLMTIVATLLLMCSLAAFSVLCSVYAKQTRQALIVPYACLLLYLACLPVVSLLLNEAFGTAPAYIQVARPIIDFVNAGNPFYSFTHVLATAGSSKSVSGQLITALESYAVFHIALTLGCLGLAIIRLRRRALHEAAIVPRGKRRARKTRVVWEQPIIWKEMQLRPRRHAPLAVAALMFLAVLVSVGPAIAICWECWHQAIYYEEISLAFNAIYIRAYATLLTWALLLAVALKASNAIALERQKQTLDTLLSTPLSRGEILLGKWLGSLLSIRYGLLWLAGIWTIGLVSGGLHPLAVPCLSVAILIYAACCASVGLLASVVARTPTRSHVLALAVLLCLTFGHFLFAPVAFISSDWRLRESYGQFASISLTPPIALEILGFYHGSLQSRFGFDLDGSKLATFVLIGFGLWSVVAIYLYWLAYRFFGRVRTDGSTKKRALGRLKRGAREVLSPTVEG